jgi:hypothetical protein
MFTKPLFTYFEITLIQIHFAKTTLGFSVITKIPCLFALLNFQKKIHITYTSFILTNTYFILTKYMPSITNARTVTALPPKKNLVPRFGRKTFKGREANHPSKAAENNHTRED